LRLKHDEPLSNFASNFNLRLYSSYRDCLAKLEGQVEALTAPGGGGAAAAAKGVRKGNEAQGNPDAVTVGPKRLKGAKLVAATEAAGGEGFRQGLTLVHFPTQPEPFLVTKPTLTTQPEPFTSMKLNK